MKKYCQRITLYMLALMPFVGWASGVAYAQTAPAAPPAGGTFEQRLTQRKSEQNVQLDEKGQKRMTSKCIGAQNVIRTVQQKGSVILNDREKAYGRIDGILWVVIGELKLADQDTFDLERQRIQFAADVETFQTTADYYLQTLDDITVINCQADPVGFTALINTARLYHQQIRDQSTTIKTYVVDTIKPTLAKHTEEL